MAYTDVRFADGFESGDLAAGGWSLLGDGAAVVEAAAAHTGAFGLRLTNTGTQAQFVRKNLGAPLPNLSVGVWLRMGAGAGLRQLVDARDSGGGHLLDLYWDAGASRIVAFVFKQTAGGSVELDSASGSVPVDTWTHVEMQVDCSSASGDARLLVNGVSVATVTDNFDRASDVSLLTLYNADGAFTVMFDDVQVAAWQDVVADTTPPTAPPGLSALAISGTRVNLTWGAASDNVGVESYLVERDGTQIAIRPGLSYSDTGAAPGNTYSYRVRATDAAGNIGPYSNVATATTPAVIAEGPLTLAQAMGAIAAALEPISDQIPGLQITPYLNPNPTPPSIDIYPGDPFQTGAGYGVGNTQLFFTIRSRVTTADQQAGQSLLLRMLDPNDPASVEAAAAEAQVQGGAVVVADGVSGFREYLEDQADNGRLLGCEWRVSTFL